MIESVDQRQSPRFNLPCLLGLVLVCTLLYDDLLDGNLIRLSVRIFEDVCITYLARGVTLLVGFMHDDFVNTAERSTSRASVGSFKGQDALAA